MKIIKIWIFLFSCSAVANPFIKVDEVPTDTQFFKKSNTQILDSLNELPRPLPMKIENARGEEALRVQIDWSQKPNGEDLFRLTSMTIEPSGTAALRARNKKTPSLFGSYRATLKNPSTGEIMAWDTIGTGKEFRKLSRAISFRFPKPETEVLLSFYAEHPVSGETQLIFEKLINPSDAKKLILPVSRQTTDVTLIRAAKKEPKLIFTIFAEGYKEQRFRDSFIQNAQKVVAAFEEVSMPHLDNFEFRAVFALSNESLGKAENLGMPVPDRDSFLGLYYPYWNGFGRWYHVVYPTRVKHYRDSIGQVAYDYPLTLVDSGYYWGVGNFKELTAIPADSNYFAYLLTHEFGHFMGLNEEYEDGGRTELEFAPNIEEPWSQNITFLKNASELKWKKFVDDRTPLPTPNNFWRSPINPEKPLGAFRGGYAQSPANTHSHKPGLSCVMKNYRQFCEVCLDGMNQVIERDLGIH